MSFGSIWPVVDCHFHVGVAPTFTFIAEDELIPWMDRAKIDVQMIFQINQTACHQTSDWNPFTGNDYIAKIQHMFPERVIGLGSINPWLQPPKGYTYPLEKRGEKFELISRNLALEECKRIILDLGLRGVKMHPREHGYPMNHWTVRAVVDELVALQRQIGKPLVVLVHAAGDSMYNSPEAFGDLAKDYPDMLFLMSHVGYMWGLKTVASVVGPYENVLFDVTGCPVYLTDLVELFGPERFVAGTDGPYSPPSVKNAIVEAIFPDPEDQAFVHGGNLVRRLEIQV